MLIAGMGYTTGYNATFPFEKPGDEYLDHNWLGMRLGYSHATIIMIYQLSKAIPSKQDYHNLHRY